MANLQGKLITTNYGQAVIIGYDQQKEKFAVEYVGQHAIGWLTESQFSINN